MQPSLEFVDKFPTIQEKTFATIWMFNRSSTVARDIASDEKDRSLISECFFQIIMTTIKDMKKLSEKANDFNIEQVVKLTVDSELEKIAGGILTHHIHWAPTQSGKSALKAVKILVYLMMNVPVVVITKGKSESIELESKISTYLEDSRFRFENRIFSVYQEEDIEESFLHNEKACCTIIPDSYQKIELAHYLVSESAQSTRRCALILDEVDAIIHRSEEQKQKNEKAMMNLQEELKPSMVMVTATPIPLFEKYLKEKAICTTSNKTIGDYIGVQNMDHTDIDPGSLMQREPIDGVVEISPKHDHENVCKSETSMRVYASKYALFKSDVPQLAKKFPKVCRTENIPRIDSQCIGFLKKEITKVNAVGMLALVDTCPWVSSTKKGTVFQQASGVQDYFAVLGHEILVVVVHADKIFYRFPRHRNGFRCYHSIGELIDEFDERFGLDKPVVVFGYHALKRSRSYRSSNRVPSSIILCLGKGQSAENCRQAAGRATYKGKKMLLRNRKTDKVPILCPRDDFTIIQKYDLLTEEIVKLHNEGGLSSWEDMKLSLSPENNFLDDCHRRFGNFTPASGKKKRIRKASHSANRLSGDDEDTKLFRSLDCKTSTRPFSPKICLEDDVIMTEADTLDQEMAADDSGSYAHSSISHNLDPSTEGSEANDSLFREELRNRAAKISNASVRSQHCPPRYVAHSEDDVIEDDESNRQESSLSGSSHGCPKEQLDTTPTSNQNILHTSDISVPKQQGKRKGHPTQESKDCKKEPDECQSDKRFEADLKHVKMKFENFQNKRSKKEMFDLTYGDVDCPFDLTEDHPMEKDEPDGIVSNDESMIDIANSEDQESVIDLADGDDKGCAINLVEGEDWASI